MKRPGRLILFALSLALLGLLPPAAGAQETTSEELWDGTVDPSTQQGSHEVIVVPEDRATCGLPFTFTYTTFEHPQASIHRQQIHPAEGFIIPGSGMEFNANWVTLESGPYSGNPSGGRQPYAIAPSPRSTFRSRSLA